MWTQLVRTARDLWKPRNAKETFPGKYFHIIKDGNRWFSKYFILFIATDFINEK